MPETIINGTGNYATPITSYETIAALRTVPAADSPTWSPLAYALVEGTTVFRDGGNYLYVWDPVNVLADNSPAIIKPTAITGAGRWVLVVGTTGGGAGGAALFVGTGSPEGVVTANPGSFYVDSLTGDKYAKRTGVGNTGWA